MSAQYEKPRALYALLLEDSGDNRFAGWYNDRDSAERNGKLSHKRFQVKVVFV
jgi:hypothetical protein